MDYNWHKIYNELPDDSLGLLVIAEWTNHGSGTSSSNYAVVPSIFVVANYTQFYRWKYFDEN